MLLLVRGGGGGGGLLDPQDLIRVVPATNYCDNVPLWYLDLCFKLLNKDYFFLLEAHSLWHAFLFVNGMIWHLAGMPLSW